MWGIAKLVRDEIGIEYGNGLWEKNLEDQLAWRVAQCTLKIRPSYSTEWALERKIPTWSWASMDGAIEVPERMTDRPHYTVKDHNARPLAFDLVGVKRGARPHRLGEQPAPIQQRGMSDSVMELQKRYKETNESEFQHASRDDPPNFYSESIPMQGHVGRGLLKWSDAAKKWSIIIEGVTGGDIEIYPDTIPRATASADMEPYFIVLSAKQASHFSFKLLFGGIPSKAALGFQAGNRAVPKPKSTRTPGRT